MSHASAFSGSAPLVQPPSYSHPESYNPPPPHPSLRPGISIIAFYNYKGGVGKTTNLIQVASHFARAAGKVTTLMVDADPQCNLTTFFTKSENKDIEDDESAMAVEEKDEDDGGDIDETIAGGTINVEHNRVNPDARPVHPDTMREDRSRPSILTALKPVFDAPGADSILNVDQISPLPARISPRLWLLKGNSKAITLEQQLSNPTPTHRTALLGCFRQIILSCARKVGAQVVLVDFGPSSGVFNQTFVMSCDYILPSAFADFYSLSSVDGLLNTVIPTWLKWHVGVKKTEEQFLEENPEYAQQVAVYGFKPEPPRILPFIVTSYRIAKGTTIAFHSSQWIASLQEFVDSPLSPAVRALFWPFQGSMMIPLLRHMGQALQLSHIHQVAFVSFDMPGGGGVRSPSGDKAKIKQAKRRYATLCTALLQLPPVAPAQAAGYIGMQN
jgi:cellulose biosynthesis protein BcsQ